ncbi:hypothetical protein [Candidatus Uabimicrobium amorphum]|uniref:Aerotolerance regulator N-terminal domain-containing protein n=1 Tax=Uabimicrobium amorphum TaxID=2596890 RepID=A0A5S9IL90_UABAM|nr:hypothetical protein [Candidatus Uabimicrobium amorphum]BBM83577.1 hypothetical protein UABAM_01930 [Candidatus Uabimicrobium amorphum]
MLGTIFFLWHLLSLRVPQKKVSSLELWNLTSQTAGYKKFTLLALIIYILLVITLAHPAWFVKGNKYLIVLDRSSSMMTISTKNTTVFDRGKSHTQKLLQRFSTFDHIEVLVFPQKQYIEGTREEITKKLAQTKCTHIPANINQMLSNIDFSAFDDVFIITDGTQKIENWPGKKIFVGNTTTNNLGIIHFHSQQIAVGKWRVFFAIKNFSTRNQKTLVTAFTEKTVLWQEKIFIAAQQITSQSFLINSPQVKTIRISVQEKDNFSLDNTLRVAKTKMVLTKIPKNHRIFARLFSKIPGIATVENNQPTDYFTCEYNQKKTTVFLNQKPPWANKKPVENSPELFFIAHPLWDWVLPNIRIQRAIPLQNFQGEALLQTAKGPIITYSPQYLYIGFALHESNWPTLPSFPIFWVNYFDYLFPHRDNFYCALVDESQTTVQHDQQKFYNHINETESNNVGLSTADIVEIPSSFSLKYTLIIRPILLGVCILLLLYLWWKE